MLEERNQEQAKTSMEQCRPRKDKMGHKMSNEARAKTVANLLTILCSERDVHPVITMSNA